MSLAGTVARLAARHGAPYTLLRKDQATGAQTWKAGTETLSFDYVQARERGYKAVELRGGIQEGDVLIVVDASSGCRAPLVGDRVALGTFYSEDECAEWRQVVSVYEARNSGVIHAYRLQARR